jgi:ribosomal protein S18 acetylase RimI-like enzyme
MALSPVTIQITPESRPTTPPWMGEAYRMRTSFSSPVVRSRSCYLAMGGELCIRSFEVDDQEPERQHILEGLGEHFGYIDETLNPDLDDVLHNYLRVGYVFVVACIGRELVGTGALLSHGEGISELVRISTRKDYRRRGIGQTVVTHLVNVARQRGDRRIIVKTNASWHDAINLYKRLDFVEYGRTTIGVDLELLLAAP